MLVNVVNVIVVFLFIDYSYRFQGVARIFVMFFLSLITDLVLDEIYHSL